MVAIMDEALELEEGMSVMEIGAGSGYHAATIAELVGPKGHVFTIERLESLVQLARRNLDLAGYSERVTLVLGDGTVGYPDRAPYERILVTAAAPDIPRPLVDQLALEGLMLIPVGDRFFPQELVRVRKTRDGVVDRRNLGGVAFVPLVGQHGFRN